MARRPFTAEELQELRPLAARWGKIVARRAFGDDGPGLDVDFDMMEQIAHAAAQGLTEGTLQTLLDGQTAALGDRRRGRHRLRRWLLHLGQPDGAALRRPGPHSER